MRKAICIIEGNQIKKYRLGKVCLPLTVVRKHLYRTDDRFFHCDKESDECLLFVDLESTQVYGDGIEAVDPDDAIAMLDSSAGGGKKNVGFISLFMNNPMVFVYFAIGVVIILSAFGVKI